MSNTNAAATIGLSSPTFVYASPSEYYFAYSYPSFPISYNSYADSITSLNSNYVPYSTNRYNVLPYSKENATLILSTTTPSTVVNDSFENRYGTNSYLIHQYFRESDVYKFNASISRNKFSSRWRKHDLKHSHYSQRPISFNEPVSLNNAPLYKNSSKSKVTLQSSISTSSSETSFSDSIPTSESSSKISSLEQSVSSIIF